MWQIPALELLQSAASPYLTEERAERHCGASTSVIECVISPALPHLQVQHLEMSVLSSVRPGQMSTLSFGQMSKFGSGQKKQIGLNAG